MKTIVVIPCHNQDDIISVNINRLLYHQKIKPNNIIIVNDNSKNFNLSESDIVKITHTTIKGRSSTRNLGIKTALELNPDIIIFMDGDTLPEHDSFISNYIELFKHNINSPKIIFGTRTHIPKPSNNNINTIFTKKQYPYINVSKYPSDLLTGNMDKIISNTPISYHDLDNRDLRIISGVTDEFNNLNNNEKIDMILSGMVTWSCNFASNKSALLKLKYHNISVYGREFWFDENDFNSGWGYEDIALGLDAMFANIDISITKSCGILHLIHERSDELHNHIQGKHKIMNRYRKLYKNKILNTINEL